MNIKDYLDKDNLHHAYLIQGRREDILPSILGFVETLGIKTLGNPDFSLIKIDSLKIDEARSLRSMAGEKGYNSARKFFVVCANSISLDAEQALLKMFEEPIENTHFFLVVPEIDALLSTLTSRFFTIKNTNEVSSETKEAEIFLTLPLRSRLDFLKELLVSEEDEEVLIEYSPRAKALKFINALEFVLHDKIFNTGKAPDKINYFEHILKTREFLRMPGSSAKSLMESVALVVPIF